MEELLLSNTRVLSGASFILYLPVEDKIAYSIDDHQIQLSTGEIRYRMDVLMLRIARVEEFVKILIQRSIRPPVMLKPQEYADRFSIDRANVVRFCRSALGAFFGVALLSDVRSSYRIPEDIDVPTVMMAKLSRQQNGVPARDLIMAALMSGHSTRGLSIVELCKRLKINREAANKAVRQLIVDDLVVRAGRGKIRLNVKGNVRDGKASISTTS